MAEVRAEMVANVWQVKVAVGDRVTAGTELVVLESMKMEIPVEAPCAGSIQEIRVQEGDNVEENAVLAVID